MPQIQAEISDEDLAKLTALAKQRGVNANTVLQQAITTEALIAANVQEGDDLLIKKGVNSFSKIEFSR